MKRALSDYDFHKVIIEGRPNALVVCYTPDSGLCKLVVDLAEEIGDKYAGSLQVYIMHVVDSKDTFLRHRVISLPTILYFKDGALVSRLTDLQYSPTLKKSIENLVGGDFILSNPLFTEITDENYDSVAGSYPGLLMLNFWLSGLETCWVMEKDLAILARKYEKQLKIGVVNWKESKDLATRFRVADIPTMLLIHRQQEEDRIVGMKSTRTIENAIRHVGYRCGVIL